MYIFVISLIWSYCGTRFLISFKILFLILNIIFIKIGTQIESLRLEHETVKYIKLVDCESFKCSSTHTFWKENIKEFPLLSELALILLNIPASSAFIERFYSICGNVCKPRAGNMTPKLIIERSFLKSNIHILDSLSRDFLNDL